MPRSGHHLLVNCLFKYFSEDMAYPVTSGRKTPDQCEKVLQAGKLHYCEYYNHCFTVPCTDPLTNFQKNHDFYGDLEKSNSSYYIVQYRHPLEFIVAHYEFMTAGRYNQDKDHLPGLLYWLRFIYGRPGGIKKYLIHRFKNAKPVSAMPQISYWKDFANKWIINNNDNTCYIFYNDLISDLEGTLENVIRFIDPATPIKKDLVKNIASGCSLRPKRDITEFRFYDPELFKQIEHYLSAEIEELGLYRYFL